MSARAASWSRRRVLGGLAALAAGTVAGAAASATDGPARASSLDKIRERGTLSVALYHDLPPFHVDGRGIDVTLAEALAQSLGVKLALLPFHADDSMADDLRNMVWRGHYLGYGPADVMLHVPVDKPLIDATPQVHFFAPYYRETVAIARNIEKVPTLPSLSALAGQRVAVAGQTLAGWLLIGADDGAYRDQLTTNWKDGAEAAQALVRGEFSVAAGNRSELESMLGHDSRFAIEALPSPRAPRDGWAVGCAVKRDATELAMALQAAINTLEESGRLKSMFRDGGVEWRRA